MTYYFVGIGLGSFALLLFFTFALHRGLKNKRHQEIIKSFQQLSQDKINNDLHIWSKYTNNKFIKHGFYKTHNKNNFFEVDGILITKKAIFFIEIKSIKGGVRGSGNELRWEKIVSKNTTFITNPIIENDDNIYKMANLINVKVPTISLIIYSNHVHFLDVNNVPDHVVIVKHIDLFTILDELNASLPKSLSDSDIKFISSKIKKEYFSKRGENENNFSR